MDASRVVNGLCAFSLVCLCGCTLGQFSLKPRAQQQQQQQPAVEPPMVVQAEPVVDPPNPSQAQGGYPTDASAPLPEIENWASQVARRDDLRSRIERRTAAADLPAELEYPPAAQLVSDETLDPALSPPSHSDSIDSEAGPQATSTKADLQPPVLQNVVVRTNTPSIATRAPSTPTPSINGPRQTLAEPATLQSMLDRIAAESADASFREQFERRVLHALAGQDEQARQPLQLFAAEQQELVAGFVELLLYLRDVPPGETSDSLRAARAAVTRLEKSIRRVSGLRIPTFVICTRVEGFGNYSPMEPAAFRAGSVGLEFVAYCEIADFDSEETPAGGWKSEFALEVTVLDRIGQEVHSYKADKITDVCRSRRQDCFIAPLVTLPASLGPGEYTVKVTVVDQVGDKVAERRAMIRLSS
jgi:hypothetical protein